MILLCFGAIGVLVVGLLSYFAVRGDEDEAGFHFAKNDDVDQRYDAASWDRDSQ